MTTYKIACIGAGYVGGCAACTRVLRMYCMC